MNDILAKSLLNKIERLEAFEERLGVRFENISLKVLDNGWVNLMFELHTDSTTLEETIKIEGTAYDVDGQILEVETTYAIKDRFFVFEVFKLSFQEDGIADKINKLRLYPKKH
jgi:hypothetical protein